jgi:hypothetical protein
VSIKLKVTREAGDGGTEISAQVELPTQSMTFTMSPLGARQLADHLVRMAAMIEQPIGGVQ